jgi:phosphopantetheine adenylyltransferase
MNLNKTFIYIIISTLLIGCKEESTNSEQEIIVSDTTKINNSDRSLNTVIENKLFSIPSPIQTAMLVKEVNTIFDADLLNPLDAGDNYITEQQKALGLGVYGTNISYLALFNETKLLIDYISYVETLADELGFMNSFSSDLLEDFQQNLTNEDSILVILSEAFRKGDDFLKENQRKEISMFILTGGFIETMYLATQIHQKTNSDLFIQRIAEQKETVKTIIEVLSYYNTSNENYLLIQSLVELLSIYDKMGLEYVYIPSETDVATKTTTIKGKSLITMDKTVKEELIEKIQQIRNSIIS